MAGRIVHWRPPRSCEEYWSEFSHCRSLRSHFQHYYTFGSAASCQQWKQDYYACREWENSRDAEAKVRLQHSERARLAGQRTSSPVWNFRLNPPADWNTPLPQDTPKGS